MAATEESVRAALAGVEDPEIHRPITDLGMVRSVAVAADGTVTVGVYLTVAACPMRDTLEARVRTAVEAVPGVRAVAVELDVMDDAQRARLHEQLRGPRREVPFARPGSLTRVYAVASGKGGVGKSSLTVNLAVAMAADGLAVGLLDADVYGHSVPRMLGATGPVNVVEGMIIPTEAFGVRVISVLPFKPGGLSQPVAFRGPRLHGMVEQLLTDVWWGDLDVLLLDLPPGTGDVAISVPALLPTAELVVVTTPQRASAEVAVRAGMLAVHTGQRVAGVVENMSAVACPHCGEPMDLFGSGGGSLVAAELSEALGADVPLLGRVPFDLRLREGGDEGRPLVAEAPDSPAALVLADLARRLGRRPRSLAGMSLGLSPARR